MKVKMTAESKKAVTIAELDAARNVIATLKEDMSAAEVARMAINAAMRKYNDTCDTVLEATAEIAKNIRVYDAICENSGKLDVWIQATARTMEGFCIVGAYLTDIWTLNGDNAEECANRMFIRYFSENR